MSTMVKAASRTVAALIVLVGAAAAVHGIGQPRSPIISIVAVGPLDSSGTRVVPLSLVVDARTRRVFVANASDDSVTVLDADSGTKLQQVLLGRLQSAGTTPFAMAVDERRGYVYIADNMTVLMLDARNGRVVHVFPGVGADPQGLAVDMASGHIVSAAQGVATVLDPRHGVALRTVVVGLSPLVAAAAEGQIMVMSTRSLTVSALDARKGAVLYRINLATVSGSPLTSLVVEAQTHRAFIATDNGLVVVLDLRRHRVMRIIRVGSSVSIPYVAAVDGRAGRVVVVSAREKMVSLLDARQVRILKVVRVGSWPHPTAVDERKGRTYVLDMSPQRTMSVFDTRQGTMLRSIHIGVLPYALAVDQQTGHVFVADSGGPQTVPDPWQPVRVRFPFLPLPISTAMHTLPPSVIMLDTSRW